MTPGVTYCIRAGVRRAKVFQLAGLSVIRADIFDPRTGKKIGSGDVLIDQLRSPKDLLDLTARPAERKRYESIERAVRSGHQHQLPAIEVQPGTSGCRIADIRVIR